MSTGEEFIWVGFKLMNGRSKNVKQDFWEFERRSGKPYNGLVLSNYGKTAQCGVESVLAVFISMCKGCVNESPKAIQDQFHVVRF